MAEKEEKKTTAKKATAEKKPAAKKTTTVKAAAEKKPAAKKTTVKKADVEVVKKAAPKAKTVKMEDLKEAVATVAVEAGEKVVSIEVKDNTPKKRTKDALGRLYATGKRKDARARVWLKSGTGKIVVNGKELEKYFVRPVLRMIINQPFAVTNRIGQYDVMCTVSGGGLSGQAGALRHGISRCLNEFEPELRSALKQAGFLTRDPRTVERKKYGMAKARKRFQFSKR